MPISLTNLSVISNLLPSTKFSGVGALSALDQNSYDFTTVRYPTNVGSQDVPHYVLFNINLPTNSKYIDKAGGSVAANSASQNNYDTKNSLGGIYQLNPSNIGNAAAGGAALGLVNPNGTVIGGAASAAAIDALGTQLQIRPKLTRVKKAIAIYMPDTVLTEYSQDWGTVSITEALGKGGQAAALGSGIKNVAKNLGSDAVSLYDAHKTGQMGKFHPVLYNNATGAESVGSVAQAFGAGNGFTELALRSVNAAVNPQVEMVFRGTANRSYLFVFDFQPRNSVESSNILDIIKTFRMYAAPEINREGAGRYFIPPAQFDISYLFNNK